MSIVILIVIFSDCGYLDKMLKPIRSQFLIKTMHTTPNFLLLSR